MKMVPQKSHVREVDRYTSTKKVPKTGKNIDYYMQVGEKMERNHNHP